MKGMLCVRLMTEGRHEPGTFYGMAARILMKIQFRFLVISLFALLMLGSGCGGFVLVEEREAPQRRNQALSSESCQDRCKRNFHACKDSPRRGGGPGASACAHEKNSCERRCR